MLPEFFTAQLSIFISVTQFFRGVGIEDDQERAALHVIGFPIETPAEGETAARTSPELADRWLSDAVDLRRHSRR